MLHHSVRRHCALPGNSVNLIHSADLGGTEMTRQQQSRALQCILLLAELLGRLCTFPDSCLQTPLGKEGELALWPHCKRREGHILCLSSFPGKTDCSSDFSWRVSKENRSPSAKKRKKGEPAPMWEKKGSREGEDSVSVSIFLFVGVFLDPQHPAEVLRDPEKPFLQWKHHHYPSLQGQR